MKPYGEKQQKLRLEQAVTMFKQGRDIPFVKKITGLTLAAMKRAGMIYEIIIPDPAGWEVGVHNGHMLHTDQWRPVIKKEGA